ncbi:MAG: hypothetical protein Q9160_001693 [Pyrenula sp. 1 TL-2023]
MAPLGKKKKATKPTKPSANKKINAEPESCPAQIPLPADSPPESSSSPTKNEKEKDATQDVNSQRWYNRTWPRKAAPVTQIARESISSASNAVSEIASTSLSGSNTSLKSSRSTSIQLTKKPSRAAPADATTTKVNAVSGATSPPLPGDESRDGSKKTIREDSERPMKQATKDISVESLKSPPENMPSEDTQSSSKKSGQKDQSSTETLAQRPADPNSNASRWLGWFSRPVLDERKSQETKPDSASPQPIASSKQDQLQGTHADGGPSQPTTSQMTDSEPCNEKDKPSNEGIDQNRPDTTEQTTSQASKRTWLQMFSNTSADALQTAKTLDVSKPSLKIVQPSQTPTTSQPDAKTTPIESSPPPNLPGDGKSSGWAFWSRDHKDSSATTEPDCHIGELAVSNTPSQKRPKRTSISLEKPAEVPPETKTTKKQTNKQLLKQSESQQAALVSQQTPPKESKKGSPGTGSQDVEIASKALQKAVPNQLFPSFQDTFLLQESPTFMQQLSRLLGYTKSPEPKHLHLIRDPPRIKNALAIGVHGYFPAPLIRTVLGQPTGTSIKFADMATKAIRKWTASRGYDCEVKSAALEGEGRIEERVALLWKLLLNWIDEIRKSDFILLACHSQGVPVALMLVAKLISFGCISSARVGICAMAGVNMGPFPDYKSRWISGSAGELFEFSNPASTVSRELLSSLETCLAFGVRVTYVGSIDDQLVSLESSIFSPISHPHIYRAVFIDGRVHAPNL